MIREFAYVLVAVPLGSSMFTPSLALSLRCWRSLRLLLFLFYGPSKWTAYRGRFCRNGGIVHW